MAALEVVKCTGKVEAGLEERVEHAANQSKQIQPVFRPASKDKYTICQHCEHIASTPRGYLSAHMYGKPIPSPNVFRGSFVERGIIKTGWNVNQSNGT